MQDEMFETLLKTEGFKLERIVSAGQATPEWEWYDQDTEEWVILLSGSAGLLFEDEETTDDIFGHYQIDPTSRQDPSPEFLQLIKTKVEQQLTSQP